MRHVGEGSDISIRQGGLVAAVGTIVGGGLSAGLAILVSLGVVPEGCEEAVFNPWEPPDECLGLGLPAYHEWWAVAGYIGGLIGCGLALTAKRYPLVGTTVFLLALMLPFTAAAAVLATLLSSSPTSPLSFFVIAGVMLALSAAATARLARSLNAWASGARS